MGTFFASVCTVAVAAGILTAAAATNGAPVRRDTGAHAPKTEINRAGKTDRLPRFRAGTITVRTISISPAQRQEAARELDACESVVSPLADRVASRHARQCAT